MGGNAIKGAKRLEKDEYLAMKKYVTDKLNLHNIKHHVIQAYETKPSFGDMDIIIVKQAERNVKQICCDALEPLETIHNGNVSSLNVQGFQVDLIFESEDNFDFATKYFAFNDLGNLIGRVAHRMGFKFGHDGVWFVMRDGDHVFGEICLTKDFSKGLTFFGFDAERYKQGFKTLEDIFTYVSSSKYFNRDLYPLEHRNHIARMRDRKRKTYTAFLDYCDKLPQREEFQFVDKDFYVQQAFMIFPNFENEYSLMVRDYEISKIIKSKFNGNMVMELTGLTGKNLGKFMSDFKQQFGDEWQIFALVTEQQDINNKVVSFMNN